MSTFQQPGYLNVEVESRLKAKGDVAWRAEGVMEGEGGINTSLLFQIQLATEVGLRLRLFYIPQQQDGRHRPSMQSE